MTKTLLICLSLPFALLLAGASGIASDTQVPEAAGGICFPAGDKEKALALFIDALLEKDPDIRCRKILEVAAADPANAETPLKAFYSSLKKTKNPRALLAQFNSIWKKNPDNFYFVLFGTDANKTLGTPAAERLKLLEKFNSIPASALWSTPGWTRDITASILRSTAECYMELEQYEKIRQLFEKWHNAPAEHRLALYVTLGGTCYTAAAKSYCTGKNAQGKALEKCFYDSVTGLEKLAPSINDNKSAWSTLLFYNSYRPLLGDKSMRFAQEYYLRTRSASANVWRMEIAVDMGNMTIFNEAVKEISAANPRFNPSELRFKALLNAEKFAEARKEISALPEKRHYELLQEFFIKQKKWTELYALVTDRLSKGAPDDAASGLLLLTVAHQQKSNREAYSQALRVLVPFVNNPDIANSVAYISAELGYYLDNARKLLEVSLKKEPGNYAYLDTMAWICFKQKRYAEAEKWIQKALAAATPHNGMAVILDHKGDIAAAQRKNPRIWYQLAIKYAPFDKECNPAEIMKKLKALK